MSSIHNPKCAGISEVEKNNGSWELLLLLYRQWNLLRSPEKRKQVSKANAQGTPFILVKNSV
jgi:hypothetical protein